MERKRNFIFTNKKHTQRGIMSTILGVISLCSLILAIYQTYEAGGQAELNMGVVGGVSLLFAVIGIVLGVMGKMEEERFLLFAYLGISLNIVVLFFISMILYAGAYGL